MAIKTGQEVGLRLCEALGVDFHGVTEITLKCKATGLAEVTIVRFVEQDTRIVELLSEYSCVKRETKRSKENARIR